MAVCYQSYHYLLLTITAVRWLAQLAMQLVFYYLALPELCLSDYSLLTK